MNNNWIILAEIVITLIVVVGFCLWQLHSLKKLKQARKRDSDKS